jgi:hypothetical protein
VVRLTLLGTGVADVAPSDVGLFEGPLSETQLGRWTDDDLSDSLRDRLVPSTVYAFDGSLRVVPHRPLRLGAEHSVALRPNEVHLPFWTQESGPAPAARLFPSPEAEPRGGVFAYCADSPAPDQGAAPLEVELEPGGQRATVGLLSIDPRCVLLVSEASGGALAHPPRTAFGLDLDPGPLRLSAAESSPTEISCDSGEIALGRACARVEDDRLVVGPSTEDAFYVFERSGQIARRSGAPGLGFEWRGLEPETTQTIRVAIVTASGVESLQLSITTPPARPRLQIAEVMANPVGPEPQQEWIELHNEGTAAAETAGVELVDAAGSVPLSSFTLAPGGRVLLVRSDFDAAATGLQLEEAALVRLPSLGGNGLSNQGEALSLRRDGIVLSESPAEPKPKEGLSLARGEDPATGAALWSLGPPTPLVGPR